jgi:acetoin utilization protein AcuB
MVKVSQWMTKDPVTIDRDASIIEAIHLMKDKNIRRLPVISKGKFCGLITDRMIKEFSPSKATSMDTWELHYLLAKCTVKDAMNPRPFTITPEDTLCKAAQMVRDNKLYGLCVTDRQNNLVGILTTTNFMEALIYLCKAQPDS